MNKENPRLARMFSAVLLCLAFAVAPRAFALESGAFAARAQKIYSATRVDHQKNPGSAALAWKFGRATFDAAEYATNSSERALLAQQGIDACREVIAADPRSAPGHYYLGMNLAQLARTRGIGALKLVKQMEAEFKQVAQLDEKFDYAGADRNLGLLYRDAPSFLSIGSRTRAHKHLQRAVDLAPNYPENRLDLIETFLRWSDLNGAKRELKALEKLWPNARKTLSGDEWAASWADWQKRLDAAKPRIEGAGKAIESPRGRD